MGRAGRGAGLRNLACHPCDNALHNGSAVAQCHTSVVLFVLTGRLDLDSVDDLLRRLEQLNEIGSSLSKERDITR